MCLKVMQNIIIFENTSLWVVGDFKLNVSKKIKIKIWMRIGKLPLLKV
jgi:hypothetical protein